MRNWLLLLAILLPLQWVEAKTLRFEVTDFGLNPNSGVDASAALHSALLQIKTQCKENDKVIISFSKGRYDFYSKTAQSYVHYISNHDQDQPKKVAFNLSGWKNLTIEGNGSDFMFHGRMIPFVLEESTNCSFRNFSVDFYQPQIAQIEVITNSKTDGITFVTAPWVTCRLAKNGNFVNLGEGWENPIASGIAFEKDTRHIVYNTSDLSINMSGCQQIASRMYKAPNWKDSRLKPGTIVALRSWYRPCPGIFLFENKNTSLLNVKVHYAEGMGLIAYRCTNITLDGFGVCLRGKDDPRYFTTQADATHFSQCKGKIVSVNGLYEGMMDDAINIHGIYLKIDERKDDYTLKASYGHEQAWGFAWGDKGDRVSFIRSNTMELVGEENTITSIEPIGVDNNIGAKSFIIHFSRPLPKVIEGEGFGIEDLTWCPKVLFSNNIVRNNRARGALFSSPLKTVCKNNLFDHTSGTAILLCGDCNGWYESGACRNLQIKNNKFVNALTNMFQFTNAIISIYPEIPNLKEQQKPFHGGNCRAIRIEKNEFITFDIPVLYAKSVEGLVFKKNKIETSAEYKPFHWNKERIKLEKVTKAELQEIDKK